jgi:coronin-1B/1C/6
VPKRGLDVMKCETARLLKLTTTAVEPLSFIVPRKGDFFQEVRERERERWRD